ncbi:MAG: hypothetical protein AB8F94_22420 [Saprospiraceae bacterium]
MKNVISRFMVAIRVLADLSVTHIFFQTTCLLETKKPSEKIGRQIEMKGTST